MKYQLQIYARALMEVLSETPKNKEEKILKNFTDLIFKNGDAVFADKILNAVKNEAIKRKGGKLVEVSFAREASEMSIGGFAVKFSEEDDIAVYYDPELIAGARITIDGSKELNNSFKYRLNKMLS